MKLQNAKYRMDVGDINPITKTLSGYENIINTICEWRQFACRTDSPVCVWVSFLCERVYVVVVDFSLL